MKYRAQTIIHKLALLFLVAPLTFANGNHSENSHGGDNSASSAGGSGGVADSTASSHVLIINGSHTDSGGTGGAGSQTGNVTNTNIQVERSDIPASSAASLSFDYCTQGFAGQGRDGGIVLGGSDPVCRQTRMIGAALPEVERLKAKGQLQRAAELSEDVTQTIELMFEDEKDRRKADQSFNLFKAVGPWLLLILLF